MGWYFRLVGSLATASMIGSLLIILTFIMAKRIRTHPTILILFLSICDFFFSFKFAFTSLLKNSGKAQSIPDLCQFQGIMAQFWGLGTLGWIGMISINLIFNLRNPFKNTSKYAIFYHIWVWGYAAITSIIMAKTGQFGESGDGTCWITQDEKIGQTNWWIMTFYVPLLVYFLCAIVALFYATARARDSYQGQPKMARSIMIRMRVFVFFFIILWIGPLVHRITQIWITFGADKKWLGDWEGITESSQGLVNSIVWITHPAVFRSFRSALKKIGCCWKEASERVPLLGRIQSELEEQEDIQKMDILMRKSIITCILLGLRKSLNVRKSSGDNFFDKYKEIFSTKTKNVDEESSLLNSNSHNLSTSTINELKQVKLKYLFKDFEPEIFEELRKIDGITNSAYLQGMHPENFLSNLKTQKFSDGKGGSFFCFSPDKTFILKTIEPNEAKILEKFIPSFFQHIKNNPKSLIHRLYGFHSVQVHSLKIYVLVMSNVFNTKQQIHELYDLKFSWVNRHVKEHDHDPSILGKDTNLKRKMKLDHTTRENLEKQIKTDAHFLASQGIMDYSLLLGFHFKDREHEHIEITKTNNDTISVSINALQQYPPSSASSPTLPQDIRKSVQLNKVELNLENKGILSYDGEEIYFVGMIDILQAYNFDKKMERLFKIKFLRLDKIGLSVQPVQVYYERFISRLGFIIESPPK